MVNPTNLRAVVGLDYHTDQYPDSGFTPIRSAGDRAQDALPMHHSGEIIGSIIFFLNIFSHFFIDSFLLSKHELVVVTWLHPAEKGCVLRCLAKDELQLMMCCINLRWWSSQAQRCYVQYSLLQHVSLCSPVHHHHWRDKHFRVLTSSRDFLPLFIFNCKHFDIPVHRNSPDWPWSSYFLTLLLL